MQPGQAAKSKAETIGRTPKLVAITTPFCLPIIFAVPIEVNLPKESVSLPIFACHKVNILRLTLVYPMRSSYTCVGHRIAIFAVAIGVSLYGRGLGFAISCAAHHSENGIRRGFAEEFGAGYIEQGVLLLATHHLATAWIQPIFSCKPIMCVPGKRLRFSGSLTRPAHATVVLGLGVDQADLRKYFLGLALAYP